MSVRRSAIAAISCLFLAYVPAAHAAPLAIATPATQVAVVGSTYSLQLVANDGSGGNQFTLTSGTLPAGLALNSSTGVVSGTPTESENKLVSITVTDNSSATAVATFRITTGWMVSTYGGTGTATSSGNGGAATSAGMQPHSVSVTTDGTVYFSDVSNGSIRKISTSGVVSSVLAGIGTVTGMWVLDNGDVVFGAWSANLRLQKFVASTSTYSQWSSSGTTFQFPRGMAIDADGNFLLADQGSHTIRKFTPDGTVSTIAGTGTGSSTGDGGPATSATINSPYDVAVDPSGNIYITEIGGYRIRKIATNGIISTVLGNGTATYTGDGGLAVNAKSASLWGIASDGAGNIFFGEKSNGSIRRIDANTGIVTRVVGTGTAGVTGSPINGISSVATLSSIIEQMRFDRNGNLFVTDYYNNMIRKIEGIGVPFNATAPTLSFSQVSNVKKGVVTTLSATASATGKVTFFANKKRIPGCINKSAIGSAPITVTCAWKPITTGSFTLSAILTPTSSPQTQVSNTYILAVARRTTTR